MTTKQIIFLYWIPFKILHQFFNISAEEAREIMFKNKNIESINQELYTSCHYNGLRYIEMNGKYILNPNDWYSTSQLRSKLETFIRSWYFMAKDSTERHVIKDYVFSNTVYKLLTHQGVDAIWEKIMAPRRRELLSQIDLSRLSSQD